MAKTDTHLAVYGNVGITRARCPECHSMALVLSEKSQCCGALVTETPSKWKRVIEPEFARRRPSLSEQRLALWRQANECLYCEMHFNSYVRVKFKLVRLSVRWDHFVPYSYSADNTDANFVAACQICNQIKTDKIFQTVDEARAHIRARRDADGITPA